MTTVKLPSALPFGTPILDMSDPDFAEKFKDAVGATPGDTIQIVTPQFHREKIAPSVHPPPEPFARINCLSYEELRSLGCRPWDEPDSKGRVLLLFPGEWYQMIPMGHRIVDINGAAQTFLLGETDDDIRFGCLAFGVMVLQGKP